MTKIKRLHFNKEKKSQAIVPSLEMISSKKTLKSLSYRICLNFYWGLLAFLIVLTLILPPEGNVRNGDFLPILFLWFLMIPSAIFLVEFGKKGRNDFGLAKDASQKDSEKEINNQESGSKNSYAMFNGKKLKSFICKFWNADYFAVLFIIWMLISLLNLLNNHSGNIRYAFNMFWIWTGTIGIFLLFRYLRPILSTVITRSLLVLVVGICLSESVFSIYTYAVRDPEFRKQYLADPDKILAENNLNLPQGSAERLLFENRLLNSTEPLGTFGLTNTLAGLLVPGLIILVGWLTFWTFSVRFSILKMPDSLPCPLRMKIAERPDVKNLFRQLHFGTFFSFLISVLLFCPILICLQLTKSRSGFIAFCFGILIYFFICFYCFVKRNDWKTNSPIFYRRLKTGLIFLFSFITINIILAFLLGFIDREVITEAGKSLSYRLDYWKASYRIILDHPILGIGPGNFQTIYPQYILPTASEFIADPHHWAFEIASLFGIPALIFFVGFLVILIISFSRFYIRKQFGPISQPNPSQISLQMFDLEKKESTTILSESLINSFPYFEYPDIESGETTACLRNNTKKTNISAINDNNNNKDIPQNFSYFSLPIFIGSLAALIIGWFLSLLTSAPLDLDFVFIAFLVLSATFGLFALINVICLKRQKLCFIILESQISSFKEISSDQWLDHFNFSSYFKKSECQQKWLNDIFYSGLIVSNIGILVNLSAAGGIAYPATMFCFWFFSALLLNKMQNDSQSSQNNNSNNQTEKLCSQNDHFHFQLKSITSKRQRFICSCLLLLIVGIAAFCQTGLLPFWTEKHTLRSNSPFIFIPNPYLTNSIPVAQNDYFQKIDLYEKKYKESKSLKNDLELNAIVEQLNQSRSHLLEISPNSAPIRAEIGNRDFNIYQTTHQQSLLESANDAFEQAVCFSPYQTEYRVRWAQTLFLLNSFHEAQTEAQKALELDRQMPHLDRKLNDELRHLAETIAIH